MAKIAIKTEVEVSTLRANLGVRYWEGGVVNGEIDEAGRIPHATKSAWLIHIDLATGAIRDWPKGTTASVHYKVCDDGIYALLDGAGGVVIERDDIYVPSMLSPKESGYGDYVIMDIDSDGVIEGWECDLECFENPND